FDELLRFLKKKKLNSRCVCKDWRAIIDARRLLRADLLPLSLASIIISFDMLDLSDFFDRPSSTGRPAISARIHDCLPSTAEKSPVRDHCNGLLLLHNGWVVNPATRWAVLLPPCPARCTTTEADFYHRYLVYDPTVSTHFEVFRVPGFYYYHRHVDHVLEESEWPPSLYTMHVYSSRSGHWEERSFVREGDAAGTVSDSRLHGRKCYAVCWQGALYVDCLNHFLRISLSNSKYQVIKPPVGLGSGWAVDQEKYLGKSEKGVYYASLGDNSFLSIWILTESSNQMEWVLKLNNLDTRSLNCYSQDHGPWVSQDINYESYFPNDEKKAQVEENFEWSSDDDDALNNENRVKKYDPAGIGILGFHPRKEIIFLSKSVQTGYAYHLKSSRIQTLGNIYPTRYQDILLPHEHNIRESFPYTPCWMRGFPEKKLA
ncbi:hypothetical protein BRADI_1g13514v3, partial [Brachypodium distachyon]